MAAVTGIRDGVEARNMRLLAHSDFGGVGKAGEGVGLHAAKGRRTLYVAHESAPKNFTGVDVTDPRNPKVVCQTAVAHEKIRSNSLSIVGNLMAVAYQSLEPGLTPVGMELFDISDPAAPRSLSFFDTSGPHSRGCHFVSLDLEGYAYLATGLKGWEPARPKDHQFILILDVRDPSRPKEVGRWWLPGTRKGDAETVPTHTDLNYEATSNKPHNINVYPDRPDRAYVAYIDGGVIILDIKDRAHPRMISRFDYHPPLKGGFTHTVVPLFKRDLLVVADEATSQKGPDIQKGAGWDHPKAVWIMDMSYEQNLVPLSSLPMPPLDQFRFRGGKFGAHNIHENDPVPTAFKSDQMVFGAFFNAGIRVFDIKDPLRPEEIAFLIPPAPAGSKLGAPQMNDVYVDENRMMYALERTTGGLYVMEMTV